MIYPPIGNLLNQIGTKDENGKTQAGTRYSLVIMTSKRARQLGNEENGKLAGNFDEAMLAAIDEINEGKIKAVARYRSEEE